MEKSYSESYAAAGVDITAGYRSVELMKQYVARTMNEHCIGGLGGFGGLFELDCTGYKHPVLISGTDGVGTKLKIAMIMDKHDTIGIDCVAMCVNDVICAGAKPLVFLDYIACGRNIPEKIAEIVKGVAEGCVQADCSLVGGETAEHPGMMPEEEYDLAGFTVGVVDKEKILSNETMAAGDVIIALPSTGVHSNGFSLVRKIFDIDNDPDVLHTTPAELGGKTLGVIGYGRIGQALGRMAQGLGMNVVAYDIYHVEGIECETMHYVTMDELLAQSDFISLHTPAIDGKPLINRENIAKMKDGVIFVNTSRGNNVDEEALLEGLNSGKIRGAGLDVYAEEPAKNEALLNHPNVSCTPHIGAATKEAQKRIGMEIVSIIDNL